MKVSWYIAKRYFFSKKSHNIINLISGISMFGIGIGAMALIVVLSAFNGIESLVEKLYSSFNPDIRIEVIEGKTFEVDSFPLMEMVNIDGVEFISRSIEETSLLKYRDAQCFVTLKGVDNDFLAMSGLDSLMFDGNLHLKQKGQNFTILGYGVADQLNVFLAHVFEPVKIYAANKNSSGSNIQDAFNVDMAYPSGIFTINPEFDYKYALVPYDFASKLLQNEGRVSSIEIGLAPGFDERKVQSQIQSIIGDKYRVNTRFEMNELLYKTNQTEKWITFFILSFILLIAAFNLLGSLTILIIDKKDDINVLQSMGGTSKLIKDIFFTEGLLISFVGSGIGILAGLILCLIQKYFGLLKLQEGTIAEYYPIDLEFFDFVAVGLISLIIGSIAAYLPAKFVANKYTLN
ncbi:MAG: ABC transporter permease [Salibacteraceae bacterium]